MSDKVFVGNNAQSLEYDEKFSAYTGVKLWVDDSNYYFAGNETGRVLEANNPFATQALANSILNDIRNFSYQPYEATGASIHPAAELGDGICVGNVYSGIYSQETSYGHYSSSDVKAEFDEEVDHEFEFKSKESRNDRREKAALKADYDAKFSVAYNQISAEVTRATTAEGNKLSTTGGNSSSFGWTLTADGFILSSGGSQVFKCDSEGIVVNGSGTFTGTITSSNATITGGTLSVGSNFSVDSSGNLTANNATITGTLTVGGNSITAANLYTGASQAATNYSTWSGTTSTVDSGAWGWNTAYNYAYGNSTSYKNSTVQNTAQYPGYFKAGTIVAASTFYVPVRGLVLGTSYCQGLATINGFKVPYFGTG